MIRRVPPIGCRLVRLADGRDGINGSLRQRLECARIGSLVEPFAAIIAALYAATLNAKVGTIAWTA